MQPRPKRVGSSEVKNRASMECLGLKPASWRALMAAIAPTTPRVPSYMPDFGMASQCDPVTTAPAPKQRGQYRAVQACIGCMPAW